MGLRLENKGKKFENRLIVTTSWDDGTISDIKMQRLLEKYSLKATFYVTKSYRYIERPLDAPEVIKLGKKSEIGAHTLTHPKLDMIDNKLAEYEIIHSKIYLEKLLCRKIKMFSYPSGRYDPKIKELVKKAKFIGARTCNNGDFNQIIDPYEWDITLHASNGSPLVILKTCIYNHSSIRSFIDWELRAKELFDLASIVGGVYHIWGHSYEFTKKNEWDKLERVFSYISNRDNCQYMTNGEVLETLIKSNFDS